MAIAIITNGTSNAVALIPIVSAALQEYYRTSSEVGATKACEHLHPILQMLWVITRGLIGACTCALDHSVEGKTWSMDCHCLCMIPPFIPAPELLPANVNPLQIQMNPEFEATINKVATGYLTITTMMDKDKLEKANKESNGQHQNKWKSIPEMMQQMIIKASSVSDEAFPNHPATTLIQILQQNKAISGRMVINAMLRNMNCQVDVPLMMVTAIMQGNITPPSLQVTHSFSCFNSPYIDAANMSSKQQNNLDLLILDREGLDKEIADRVAKDNFKIPSNSHQLRHQLNNWAGILQLIFGADAKISLEAVEWIKHID